MLSLLIVDGLLAMLAIQRGWRVAPLLLTALPWLLLPLESALSGITFAGWILPFSNLLVCAGAFSTLALLYTAAIAPEPA